MIARVTVKLPFEFTLPDGEEYLRYEYTHKGYLVLIYPPISQAKEPTQNGITIDDRPSHQVDTLVIDFQKNEFNREVNSEYDPSVDVIKEVINDFLNRIRYVVKAAQIKPITSDTDLHVQYLNEDFTELEKMEGYIRGRGTKSFKFNATAITSDIWNSVHSLPPFSELPIWRTLLLDAEALLPEVGPSVVLTFTALEVFIAKILDLKFNHDGKDNVLWEWINDRGDSYSKKPNVNEQYDSLSKIMLGNSLKERQDLWKLFVELQEARNSFAHAGIAKIGKKDKQVEVSIEKARLFILNANEIIKYFREMLPSDLQWQEYDNKIKFTFNQPINLN